MDANEDERPAALIDNCVMTQSWTSGILNATDASLEPQLTDPMIQKLFRIFLVFTDELHSTDNVFFDSKQKVHVEEVRFLCALIGRELGFDLKFSLEDPCRPQCSCELVRQLPDFPSMLSFKELLGAVGSLFPDRTLLEPAIKTVFEKIVNQVIKRGFLLKMSDSNFRSGWDMVWCVVLPGKLVYWPLGREASTSSSKRKELLLNKSGSASLCGYDKGKRLFQVSTVGRKKTVTFACFDQLEAQLWVSAALISISRCDSAENIYKPILSQLRKKRIHGSSGEKGFEVVVPFTVGERLDFEHKKRIELENQKHQLEEALQLERQAAKDEEIVRTLATRMLEEERIHRERLEKLHSEQSRQLTQEQLRREQLELLDKKRQQELSDLRQQLDQMSSSLQPAPTAEPASARANERRELLKQLKKDQEELVQYQQELKEHVKMQQESHKQFVSDAAHELLTKLLSNSDQRSSTNASRTSSTYKVSPRCSSESS